MTTKQEAKEWLQTYLDAYVGAIVTPALMELIQKDIANHFVEEQDDEKKRK